MTLCSGYTFAVQIRKYFQIILCKQFFFLLSETSYENVGAENVQKIHPVGINSYCDTIQAYGQILLMVFLTRVSRCT